MPKAERYVDYVFEKCKNDKAPNNLDKTSKLKSFTEIMWICLMCKKYYEAMV